MIDLDKYSNNAIEVKKGASGKKYKIQTPDGEMFFKSNYTYPNGDMEIRQDIIETFISNLLQKMNVPNVLEYKLAHFQDMDGCSSPNFIPKDSKEVTYHQIAYINYLNSKRKSKVPYDYAEPEKSITGKRKKAVAKIVHKNSQKFRMFDRTLPKYMDSFATLDDIETTIQQYCDSYNIDVDIDNVKQNFFNIVVIDYFLCNTDRNWQNFNFIISHEGTKLKLSPTPIYDNGYAFGMGYYHNPIFANQTEAYKKVISWLSLTDITNNSNIPRALAVDIWENSQQNNILKNNGSLTLDIYSLTKSNPAIANLVDKFTQLDINKELLEFSSQQNIEISPELSAYISLFFKTRQSNYTDVIRRIEKKTTKNNREK
ncbi:MAG: hypothetical protein IKQ31_01680 [Clostridia bacterium]|nr:hypothetical protein [Clostridia bacterium]